MSVLETFYILFKSNSAEVKKGTEETEKTVKKLEESLGHVTTNANQVGSAFTIMGRSIAGAAAAFISAGAILANLKDTYAYTLQLSQASEALNVNAESLDVWGRAVQRNGGTVEGFQQSLRGLATTLNIRNQDALRLLPMLANTFKNAGVERSNAFGRKLGLDQATIMLLQQGRREVEAVIQRQKELGTVTKQDTDIANSFNKAWQETGFNFRFMWLALERTVLPILEKIIIGFGKVAKYFTEHSNLLIGAAIGIGAAIAFLAAPFIAANAVMLTTAGIIAGLITLFAFLYDDIKVFVEGGNSLIGAMLEKWPMVGRVIKAVFDEIKEAITSVIDIFNKLIEGFNKVNSFLVGVENKAISGIIKFAKGELGEAESNPIASQTSNSIFNGGSSKSATVYTGAITINTQAKDGEEVGNVLAQHLNGYFIKATGAIDDGVLA